MHSKLLRELHLSKPFNTSRSTPQAQELKIETIQGKPLGCGHVTYGSPRVTLQVGCFHRETISFLVLDGPTVNIILGHPWLSQHSPEVRWGSSKILRRRESCFQNCNSNVPAQLVLPSGFQVNSTLVESPKPLKKHAIPSDYVAFQDVFSKQAVTPLPPHCAWDCVIDIGGKKDGGLRPCIDYRTLNDNTVTSSGPGHPRGTTWASSS